MSPAWRKWMVVGWAMLLTAACSNKPEGSTAALYGVGNLVAVGDLLLTLSTDKSELRALSLSSSKRVRGPHFVPAINPLEPLSIPVLDYPNILAVDLRWADLLLDSGEVIPQGRTEGGPFAYAASHGRGGISIVGGSREWLKEVKRFSTQAPVTAMAAFRDGGRSRLFFATYNGSDGSLWALDLSDEPTVYAESEEALLARQQRIQSYPGQVVTALSLLPDGALAVATRSTDGAAEVAALHLSDSMQAVWRTLPLGQALRMLATHAAARHAEYAGGTLPAGRWLYALLDEGSCEEEPCEEGIVAIDVEQGVVDTASPISSIGGMPISMAFAPIAFRDKETALETQTLAGVYVTGSGLIGAFDAAVPGPLKTTQAKAVSAAFFSPNAEGELVEVDYVAGPLLNEDGTPAVTVASGVSFNETVWVGAELLLPGWTNLATSDADGSQFIVADALDMSQARVGDLLEIFVGERLCAKDVPVASIDAAVRSLVITEPIPDCTGRTHFRLRAKGDAPYVVAGTKTGYMGRAGPGKPFLYAGKNFLSSPELAKPILTIEFGSASSAELLREARWELVLTAGYSGPSRDIQALSRCSTRIAAGIWIDAVRKKAYISFSSSNALVEVEMGAWAESSLGEAEVVCYR